MGDGDVVYLLRGGLRRIDGSVVNPVGWGLLDDGHGEESGVGGLVGSCGWVGGGGGIWGRRSGMVRVELIKCRHV